MWFIIRESSLTFHDKIAPMCQIAGYRTVVAEFVVADLLEHHANKANYLTIYGVDVIVLT